MSGARRRCRRLVGLLSVLVLAPQCSGRTTETPRRERVAEQAADDFLQARTAELQALLDPAFSATWRGLATLPSTVRTLQETLGPCVRHGRGEAIQRLPVTRATEVRVPIACQRGRALDMELDVLPSDKVASLSLTDGNQAVEINDGRVIIGGSPA